ncbi:MAG: xylose isomerase [Flavobacteriaceae bacterium]|nr:MAG: xylose isomerase [Flavobacteriaceae bacterium]
MFIDQFYHLTYCTNIHPGENWKITFENIEAFVPKIKKSVSQEDPFGLGLRLSNTASQELGTGENLKQFKEWLDANDIYVFTMNGFPYGNFHNEKVKDMVHAPDWTTRERVEYTKRLFNQLAYLIPDGQMGGISTNPISYKYWYDSKVTTHEAFAIGAEHMTEIVLQLHEIENSTGKYLHLDIEPEPDGMLENSDEVVSFYADYLLPIATEVLVKTLDCSHEKAQELVHKYITVCYDICHFSLAFEEPEDTFGKFREAGIKIGKIQVSAALKILFDGKNDKKIWDSLGRFNEPTYLHQVTHMDDGQVKTYWDLPALLEEEKNFDELRAHFHVPIFLDKFDDLHSTQDHILKVLEYLKKNKVSNHLEIETYTWDVLPKSLKLELSDSIIREIEWLKNKL